MSTIIREASPQCVWLLSWNYAPVFSGMAIQMHRIAQLFVAKGHSVRVLAAAERQAAELGGQTVNRDGVLVSYLKTHSGWINVASRFTSKSNYFRRIKFFASARRVLKRQAKAGDVVHIVSPEEFTWIAARGQRQRGLPVVLHMTLLGADDPIAIQRFSPWLRKSALQVFSDADAVVGMCSAQISSCEQGGVSPKRGLFRIPGGVDQSLYAPTEGPLEKAALRQKLGLPKDAHVIIFVGIAHQRKGIDTLVHAFLEVARTDDRAVLLVVGESEFLDLRRHPADRRQLILKLRDEIKTAGLEARVHWKGGVPNVHEFLKASDVFCFPTRREGFGIVTVEAMSVGLPVIVSRLEGVTTDQVQHDQTGMLVDGDDPRSYSDAITRVLQQPSLAARLGTAARAKVLEEFSLEKVSEDFLRLYAGIRIPVAQPSPPTRSRNG